MLKVTDVPVIALVTRYCVGQHCSGQDALHKVVRRHYSDTAAGDGQVVNADSRAFCGVRTVYRSVFVSKGVIREERERERESHYIVILVQFHEHDRCTPPRRAGYIYTRTVHTIQHLSSSHSAVVCVRAQADLRPYRCVGSVVMFVVDVTHLIVTKTCNSGAVRRQAYVQSPLG